VRRVATPAYEHVVFDLDGTLIDSRADLAAAVNHVRACLGLPSIVPETVYAYVGDGARALVERALGPADADRVPAALALFMDYYAAHLLDATRPYPGVAETLERLAARGIALSVLTNKPVGMSRAILEGLGLLPRFVEVIGGDSLPTRKPDPAGLELLRGLTATPRARVLLVGDSPVDVQTAAAGGVAFCGVAWGLQPAALRAARPERLIDTPQELLAVVG
jgi:phosphoglycolate phosphatase